VSTLNRLLDALPRTRLGCLSREVPAFRACGVTGFYVAVLVLIGGGLLAGRSPLVLAGLAGVCAASFFVYTYLRMWVTGRETLVLLEHVWFALAASAAWLWALGEPVLPYLDVVAVALCPFLAAGRVGCTLVGCCHGRPSRFGVVYPEHCAADGFPHQLVGVRLFPVPAIEAVALAGTGVAGLCALPFAAAGQVMVWFLLAYAVTRFGLEGLRGDRRPHLLGLSQARWMALAEVGAVLAFGESPRPAAVASFALLAGLLLVAVVLCVRWDSRRLLASRHVAELRDLTRTAIDEAESAAAPPRPESRRTAHGASIAASANGSAAHVSLSLPGMAVDLPLLCDLAAAAFPELRPDATSLSRGRILHLSLPCPLPPEPPRQSPGLGTALYARIVRHSQQGTEPAEGPVELPTPVPVPPPTPALPAPPVRARGWWFAVNGGTGEAEPRPAGARNI
jgi:prolipoprotein diacylglyceryltransferase